MLIRQILRLLALMTDSRSAIAGASELLFAVKYYRPDSGTFSTDCRGKD